MRIFTFLLTMMFITSLSMAQNAPIDFESGGYGADWTWSVFENNTNPALEIIDNPHSTGINTSAKVAKFTALQTGNPWAGTESLQGDLGTFEWTNDNRIVKIMVYKTVISDVGIKFDAGAPPNDWSSGEIKVANTKINEWEELTFDFSLAANPPVEFGGLKRIIIFPDFLAREQDNIIYFDNITFHTGGAPPADPTTAAPPPPARNAEDVISLFSDAYTDVTVDTWRTDWSQGILENVSIADNATKKYSNLNYVGIETIANQLDVSGMTHFHIDVWSANFTLLKIKLVDFGVNGIYGGGDDVEHELVFNSPAKNEWVSLDLPLSDFTGLTTRQNLSQYILTGEPTGSAIVYVDNVYFYKEAPNSTNKLSSAQNKINVYPNPVSSGELLQLSSEVSQIDIFDFSGRVIKTLKAVSVMNTNELKQGVYILKIQTNTGSVQTQKLVVK